MCRFAGGPPQDTAIWPWLDLGDHAPHEQDDLARATPGRLGDHTEKLSQPRWGLCREQEERGKHTKGRCS